ncbi:MAG: hypothetical protein ABIQ32_08690 [Sphingomicrobium sp.]
MRPWYWIVVAVWCFVMLFGLLAVVEMGWSTITLDAFTVPVLLLPALAYPFAKKKQRGTFDL